MCVTVAMKLPRDLRTGEPTKDAKWRLAKIRDRAYEPKYTVKRYTVKENGASQLFLVDSDSDWTEGVSIHENGSFLSIVNSALNNSFDKKDDGSGKAKGNSSGGVSDNGKILRKILKSHDIESAVKIITENKIDGCSLITDGKRLFVIETTIPADVKNKYSKERKDGKSFDDVIPLSEYKTIVKEIKDDYLVVRTNHGVFDKEFGYQPKDGDSYTSSLKRREYTIKAMNDNVFEPIDLITTLSKLGNEKIDKNPFFRPIRKDTDIFSTTIIQTDPSGTMIVKPIVCHFDINNSINLITDKYLCHMVILPYASRMFEMEIKSFKDVLSEKIDEIKWAIGRYKKYELNKITRSDFTIVYVNPEELIKYSHPDYKVDSDSTINHIGNRMDKVIQHINTPDTYLDPAVVAYRRYSNDVDTYPIEICDGRHRIAAMKKLGITKVPVYIMKKDKKELEKIITLY